MQRMGDLFLAFVMGAVLGVALEAWYRDTAPDCITDTECEAWCEDNPIRCLANTLIYERR
jgi:hypothetical protein